jgi:hypothetical protein
MPTWGEAMSYHGGGGSWGEGSSVRGVGWWSRVTTLLENNPNRLCVGGRGGGNTPPYILLYNQGLFIFSMNF